MTALGRATLAAAFALVGTVAACARPPRPLVFGRLETERNAPLVERVRSESPALFAKAEELRRKAEAAHRAGDAVSADLWGESSIAAYRHAVASARRIAATTRKSREAERLARATDQLEADERSRVDIDRESERLSDEITVRQEALTPASSKPADPAREAARWVAARTNVAMAETLCDAAHLLAPAVKGLSEARSAVTEVGRRIADGKGPAPIDPSARARALCLRALTRARDATTAGGGPSGDALLADLGALGSTSGGAGGLDVVRDERGVVVTLLQVPSASAPFQAGSARLTRGGKDHLEALGRVAKTHPTFAVVVVVHSAPGAATATGRDKERGDVAKRTLVEAGAAPDRIAIQTPGAQLPAFDPADPRARAGNERVEIVFVGGKP